MRLIANFKAFLVAVVVASIAGCGVFEDDPEYEWSGNITERNDRFILSYDAEQFTESQIARVDQWWIDIQTCAGISIDISAAPLIIEYVPIDDLPIGTYGKIFYAQRYARIRSSDLDLDWHWGGTLTRHEMLHYLIYITTGNDNQTHNEEPWEQCKFIV